MTEGLCAIIILPIALTILNVDRLMVNGVYGPYSAYV